MPEDSQLLVHGTTTNNTCRVASHAQGSQCQV
jgi:hypothetical protein